MRKKTPRGHAEAVKRCEDAIKALFHDTTVSQDRTRSDLKALRELIDSLLDTLK